VRSVLNEYAALEPRIRLVFRDKNGDISAATNSALAIAQGEFISMMYHDDVIPPAALFEMVRALNCDPSLDMVYSDEDQIDTDGIRFEPFFKPDWSPDYLESCMYTAHLAVYRKALVDRIGGFRSEVNGAQDYDLVLRFTEQTNRIGHVARVLYHRRVTPGWTAASARQSSNSVSAGVRALAGRLARTGRIGEVQSSEYAGCFRVRWALPREPLVSIIIPTAGGDRMVRGRPVNLVTRCVGQIRAISTYKNYEIVIVDNGDLRFQVKEELRRFGCRFTTFTESEFNISKKLNLGAKVAKGEYLLLLNDDTEIITPDWIEAMLEQVLKPGVGVVGAKLLYENGTIQHVGVTHHEGLPDHVRKFFPANDPGYNFSTISVRNYLAVTGACMLTSASNYRDVDGYDEEYKVNYSDIDYCLKLRERGLRTVYTPHAELYHYESASRKFVASQEEIDRFLARWKALTASDPYYNGEYLQTKPPDFSLRLRSNRCETP
jgi:GT2 family glycosyltransferase